MIAEYEKALSIVLPNCKTNVHIECTSRIANERNIVSNGDVLIEKCKYLNTPGNLHHYTNDFLFNDVLPLIAAKFNLDIKLDDFERIDYEKHYAYHVPKKDSTVAVFSSTRKKLIGRTRVVLRDRNKNYLSECPGTKTTYQTLYTFTHRCSSIINLHNKSNRILLLNCDSMIAPLIPILALYFKQIIVMDNRTDKSYKNLYACVQNDITDYLCILISTNIMTHKEEQNLR